MGERNGKVAVDRIVQFLRENDMVEASIHHIAAQFKAEVRGTVPFAIGDISAARRFVKSQPLTQPLLKEIPVETKKVVGLASGTKPLPIEVKPGLTALPSLPKVIVPPPPVQPPPPAVKPVEPRLLLAPGGAVGACTTSSLSEAVDELARQEGCDPAAIVVYRPVKVRVTRLIEVTDGE